MADKNGALGRLLQSKHDKAVAKKESSGQIDIQYGHNGELVVIIFSGPAENLTLSDAQAENMVKCIETVRAGLKEHKRRVAAGEKLDLGSHG